MELTAASHGGFQGGHEAHSPTCCPSARWPRALTWKSSGHGYLLSLCKRNRQKVKGQRLHLRRHLLPEPAAAHAAGPPDKKVLLPLSQSRTQQPQPLHANVTFLLKVRPFIYLNTGCAVFGAMRIFLFGLWETEGERESLGHNGSFV